MKKTILSLVVILGMGAAAQVNATGIPVVDAVQVAGQIRELSQGIRDYQEYLQQTVLSNSELLSAYQRYDQMLSDYKQVLREAEGLKSTLQGIDLQNFLNQLKNIDAYDPSYSTGSDSHVGEEPWDNAVERNKLLNGWGMSDEEWSEMNASIPYLANDKQRAQEIFKYRKNKAEGAVRQDLAGETYDNQISDQTDKANALEQDLKKLGDNDSVATQQLIARQNQLIIDQNLNAESQKNTDFKMSNQLSNDYFNNMAAARERREKAMSKSYQGNNSE